MAKLGDICKFQSGGTPAKGEPSYFGGSIPWITTVALNGSIISEQNAVDWITEKAIEKSAAKIVPANSVMVGTRVGVGKVAINKVPMSTSQDIISLLDIDECKWSKEFICKFILGKGSYLNSQARGATIKGIKIETLAGLELPDVTLEQQCKIANVIDGVDELIALRKEQLIKLDQLVKSRFIKLFGDPMANPMGWDRVNISAVVGGKVSNGFFAKRDAYCDDGNVKVLGVAHVVNRMYSNTEDLPTTNGTEADVVKYGVKYGDILFCRSSLVAAGIGKASIVPKDTPNNVLFECHVIRLPLDLNKCVPEFMQVLSTTDYFRNQVIAQSKTATMTTIGQDGILKTDIILPPLEMQKKFLAFVEQTDKSKLAIQQSLDKLELLKKSLMQEYFG